MPLFILESVPAVGGEREAIQRALDRLAQAVRAQQGDLIEAEQRADDAAPSRLERRTLGGATRPTQ
ncbi:MAG: hypothetical protein C4345_08800, partial [Chloroflexota bacterium]